MGKSGLAQHPAFQSPTAAPGPSSSCPQPMRFLLTDDIWSLDALSPAEWHLVAELPAAATPSNYQSQSGERLFPSPISPEELADEDTIAQVDDWKSFVQPDLEELFQDSRKTVQGDIEGVEKVTVSELLSPEEIEEYESDLPELRRVTVSKEHTEAWYSTLNQARILLNEEHDLAESEERMLTRMDAGDDIRESRFLLIAQYEMYSAIQIMLVEHVMGL